MSWKTWDLLLGTSALAGMFYAVWNVALYVWCW